jgi:hypothetical protein
MRARPLFLALLISTPACALQISEIMHDPSGSDTNREWIELYNNDSESYNLSGWKLVTDNVSHTLNANESSEILIPGNYAVIVQNSTFFLVDYPYFNGSLIDSSWTPLPNSVNETVAIKNASAVFDSVTSSTVLLNACRHLVCQIRKCIRNRHRQTTI